MIQVRGYCTNKEQRAALLAYGVTEKNVWMEGAGAETLQGCLNTFRGHSGILVLATDLRILGASRERLLSMMAHLYRQQIAVRDIAHPEDQHIPALMENRAILAIARPRYRDRRTAKKRGRDGGLANGEVARSKRAQIDTDTLIRNLVAEHKEIGWPVIVRICAGKLSLSTLRRHYLNN